MRSRHSAPAAEPDTAPDVSLLEPEAALARAATPAGGLSAAQVEAARERHGDNVLVKARREPPIVAYLRQFRDWMILLLLACAAITAYLGDWTTALVLIGLVLVNTAIGFAQEYRAGRTMAALERLVTPTAEVYRDGDVVVVDSHRIVVGDLVHLPEGASVPADVRLVRAQAFSTNEFALTGESDPTRKHTHALPHEVELSERHNMAYAGTTVATGEAVGLVVATGARTELGKIAALSQSAKRAPSPLQVEMARIAKWATYGVVGLSSILLVVAVQADLPFKEALLFAVGFASALIPQGLPAEVNTALASAAGVLAKKRALVKRLSAVETLGATHVICTDKTGTLTRNAMTVTELEVAGAAYRVTGTGYAPEGEVLAVVPEITGAITLPGPALAAGPADPDRVRAFLEACAYASNATLHAPDDDHPEWYVLGDPTEGALITAARKAGIDPVALDAAAEEVRELPFDSRRKRMTSVRRLAGDRYVAFVKGAPETIVEVCDAIDDGERIRPISAADREEVLELDRAKADLALRNLAVAMREVTPAEAESTDPEVLERGLVLLGMVSMTDPIRDSVPAAMAATADASIQVNIITGDSALTAEAIGRKAGFDRAGGMVVVTGRELAAMPDADVLAHALRGGTVFSRVSPDDKMRIVDLVRGAGLVVAVTGDGINDAPALRHASIGVAMGATGTDVAKEAAELVLLDDDFSTLVESVREGRRIYANISKGVLSCLTTNIAEFVVNGISLILTLVAGLPLAMNVLQILAIDLLGEIFPIAALGTDREQGSTMRRPPRDPRARILNAKSFWSFFSAGALIGLLAIGNYLWSYARDGLDPFAMTPTTEQIAQATTMTYLTMLVTQFVNIVQRRSERGIFSRYQLTNRAFWVAMLGSVLVMSLLVYTPGLQQVFGTAPVGVDDWFWLLLAAVVFGAVREAGRLLAARRA